MGLGDVCGRLTQSPICKNKFFYLFQNDDTIENVPDQRHPKRFFIRSKIILSDAQYKISYWCSFFWCIDLHVFNETYYGYKLMPASRIR